MLRQRTGDLLEIQDGQQLLYAVVLTKVTMFDGNIIFAFNGTSQRERTTLKPTSPGFNICTDLLFAKREGRARRLDHLRDNLPFWRSQSTKRRPTERTPWIVTRIDNLEVEIGRYDNLPEEHQGAMYRSVYSLDRVFSMAERNHTWHGYTQYIKNPPASSG